MKTSVLRKLSCIILCMLIIFALAPADVMAGNEMTKDGATSTDVEELTEETDIGADPYAEGDQTETEAPGEIQEIDETETAQAPQESAAAAPLLVRTPNIAVFTEEMNKLYAMDKQKKQGLYAPVPGAEHTVSRVIVKGEPDYEGYAPLKIVQDPYGYYIIQFDTPEEAASFIETQAGSKNVEWAELDEVIRIPRETDEYDPEVKSSDTEGSHCGSWGTGNVEADKLQQYILEHEDEIAGRKVIVAVVDSGVYMNHEFLQGRFTYIPEWTDPETGGIVTCDFVDQDNNPNDELGHGTHVTGTVVDCTYYLGDYISILPVRVMDASGSGIITQIAAGIYFSGANGASVINLSLGAPASIGHYINEAVQKVVGDGCTVICSSGNDNTYTYTKSPANLTDEGVIVVGGIGYSSWGFTSIITNERYCTSNYGGSVDVAAPGYQISSSVTPKNGFRYECWNGTSMAAPHVTAAAAMIKLLYPEFDPAEIERTIKSCTWDIGPKGEDIEFGAGALKLGKLNEEITDPVITSDIESKTMEAGELAEFTVEAEGSLLSYDWEYREGPEGEWTEVLPEENNSPVYTHVADYLYDGYQFRCRVSNPKGEVISDTATMHVTERTDDGIVASGTLDTGLEWKISSNMVLTITGAGRIPNFDEGQAPWYPWHNWIRIVEIPEVTRIGNNAFRDFTRLRTVANRSMSGCIVLEGLLTPDSLTSIGKYAFGGCKELRKAYFTSNITGVSAFTFYGCSNLEEVVFRNSIEKIDRMAFCLCTGLKTVTIGNTLEEIGDRAFCLCDSLTDVYFEGNSSEWADLRYPFDYNDSLDNVTVHYGLPDLTGSFDSGVTWELYGQSRLVIKGTGSIPDFESETDIPWYRYHGKVTSVEIGYGVDAIGDRTFSGMYNLKIITMPNTVTRIGDYAFEGCDWIKEIDLSAGLETIGNYAFADCIFLSRINFMGDMEGWKALEIGEGNEPLSEAFVYYRLTDDLYWNLSDDGVLAIEGTGNMNGLRKSDEYPWFMCKDEIRAVLTEDGVRGIGEEAFAGYENLETVYIQSSVRRVQPRAFFGCSGLREVHYSGTEDEWEDVTVGSENEPLTSCDVHYGQFGRCGRQIYWVIDEEGTLTIDGKGIIISGEVSWRDYQELVKTVIVKGEITELEEDSFSLMENLEKAVVSSPVPRIPDRCFNHCVKLKTVILKEGIAEIGCDAFCDCQALVNFAMSKDIVSIEENAFLRCPALNNIFYSGSEAEWATVSIDNHGNNTLKNAANKYFNYTGPIISVQPSDADVIDGAEVSMSVEAIGIDPEYQWYRKGGSNSNWMPVEGGTEAAYTFNAASNLDGNSCYCEVTDEMGSSQSETAMLSVSYSVPAITRQPLSMLGMEGKTVTFSVAATGGGLHYQWQKKLQFTNQWIDLTGNGADTPKLKVTIRKLDAGSLYRCKVTNLLGTKYSNTCQAGLITVVIKPPIFRELK